MRRRRVGAEFFGVREGYGAGGLALDLEDSTPEEMAGVGPVGTDDASWPGEAPGGPVTYPPDNDGPPAAPERDDSFPSHEGARHEDPTQDVGSSWSTDGDGDGDAEVLAGLFDVGFDDDLLLELSPEAWMGMEPYVRTFAVGRIQDRLRDFDADLETELADALARDPTDTEQAARAELRRHYDQAKAPWLALLDRAQSVAAPSTGGRGDGFEQEGERGFDLRDIADGVPETALTDAKSWDQGAAGVGSVNDDEGGGNSLHMGSLGLGMAWAAAVREAKSSALFDRALNRAYVKFEQALESVKPPHRAQEFYALGERLLPLLEAKDVRGANALLAEGYSPAFNPLRELVSRIHAGDFSPEREVADMPGVVEDFEESVADIASPGWSRMPGGRRPFTVNGQTYTMEDARGNAPGARSRVSGVLRVMDAADAFVFGLEWSTVTSRDDGRPVRYAFGATSGAGRGKNDPRVLMPVIRAAVDYYRANISPELIVVGPFTPAGYALARAFGDDVVTDLARLERHAAMVEAPPKLLAAVEDFVWRAALQFVREDVTDKLQIAREIPREIEQAEATLSALAEHVSGLEEGKTISIAVPRLGRASDATYLVVWKRPSYASAPGLFSVAIQDRGQETREGDMRPAAAVDLEEAVRVADALLMPHIDRAKKVWNAIYKDTSKYDQTLAEIPDEDLERADPTRDVKDDQVLGLQAEIPVDLSGSRYESILSKEDTITVVVYPSRAEDRKGDWANNTLRMWLGGTPSTQADARRMFDDVRGTIEHEVVHAVQTWIGRGQNLTDERRTRPGGLPGSKYDPAVDQRRPHEQRDIEFYSNLTSEVREFQFKNRNVRRNLWPQRAREWVQEGYRFNKVKERSPKLWQKMVTEFMREVLDMGTGPDAETPPPSGRILEQQTQRRDVRRHEQLMQQTIPDSLTEKVLQIAYANNARELAADFPDWQAWVRGQDDEQLAMVVENDAQLYERVLSKLPTDAQGDSIDWTWFIARLRGALGLTYQPLPNPYADETFDEYRQRRQRRGGREAQVGGERPAADAGAGPTVYVMLDEDGSIHADRGFIGDGAYAVTQPMGQMTTPITIPASFNVLRLTPETLQPEPVPGTDAVLVTLARRRWLVGDDSYGDISGALIDAEYTRLRDAHPLAGVLAVSDEYEATLRALSADEPTPQEIHDNFWRDEAAAKLDAVAVSMPAEVAELRALGAQLAPLEAASEAYYADGLPETPETAREERARVKQMRPLEKRKRELEKLLRKPLAKIERRLDGLGDKLREKASAAVYAAYGVDPEEGTDLVLDPHDILNVLTEDEENMDAWPDAVYVEGIFGAAFPVYAFINDPLNPYVPGADDADDDDGWIDTGDLGEYGPEPSALHEAIASGNDEDLLYALADAEPAEVLALPPDVKARGLAALDAHAAAWEAEHGNAAQIARLKDIRQRLTYAAYQEPQAGAPGADETARLVEEVQAGSWVWAVDLLRPNSQIVLEYIPYEVRQPIIDELDRRIEYQQSGVNEPSDDSDNELRELLTRTAAVRRAVVDVDAAFRAEAARLRRVGLPKWREEGVELPETFDEVAQYVDQPGVFFSMTQVPKLGINPGSKYNTPNGIYSYPLTADYFEKMKTGTLPFAGESDYIQVFRAPKTGVIDAADPSYDTTREEADLAKAKSYTTKIGQERVAKAKAAFDAAVPGMRAFLEAKGTPEELQNLDEMVRLTEAGAYHAAGDYNARGARRAMSDKHEATLQKLDDLADDGYFIHFTNVEKLGINPQQGYSTTPLGIYGYPLTSEIAHQVRTGTIPFRANAKWMYIFKPVEDGIYDLSWRMDRPEYIEMSKALLREYRKRGADPEDVANLKTEIKQRTAPLWVDIYNMAYDVVGHDIKQWSHLMRSLGIEGVTDVGGAGYIHENEPAQGVFFSTAALRVEGVYANPIAAASDQEEQVDEALEMEYEYDPRSGESYGIPTKKTPDARYVGLVMRQKNWPDDTDSSLKVKHLIEGIRDESQAAKLLSHPSPVVARWLANAATQKKWMGIMNQLVGSEQVEARRSLAQFGPIEIKLKLAHDPDVYVRRGLWSNMPSTYGRDPEALAAAMRDDPDGVVQWSVEKVLGPRNRGAALTPEQFAAYEAEWMQGRTPAEARAEIRDLTRFEQRNSPDVVELNEQLDALELEQERRRLEKRRREDEADQRFREKLFLQQRRQQQAQRRQLWCCVDMDGTLLEEVGEAGAAKGLLGAPKPGAAEAMQELLSLGWRVSVYTARLTGYSPDVAKALAEQIASWLTSQGVPFTDVWYGAKPKADYFVDDRAVPFEGSWNEVLQRLTNGVNPDEETGDEAADPEISTEFSQAAGNGLIDGLDGDPNDFDANDALGTRHDRSFSHPTERVLEEVVY